MPTDFPDKGDDKEIVLRNSNHKQFDYDYALDLRENHSEIWRKGGNIRGNTAFTNWGKARKNEYTAAVESWIKEREAWGDRHKENFRLAGVVAQIKWGVVGSRGMSYMKSLINEEKKKGTKNMINIELDTDVNRYTSLGILETIKNSDDDIEIGISSLGGSLDEGLKMYYALIEHKGNSTAVFKGRSASAATIFAMGAKKREIYKNSHVLIHKVLQPTMLADFLNADDIEGLIKELKKSKDELNKLDLSLANIYYQKAKKKGKEEKDILKLMSKDTWLNAKEALEWGFVDSIRNEDFEYDKEAENALLNHYGLPKVEKEKTKTMNFLNKIKAFFNNSLGLDETTANDKASEFVASFNEDLKNSMNEKFKTLVSEKSEAIETLQNELSNIKKQIGNKQEKVNLDSYVSRETFESLQNSFNELQTKINETGSLKLKKQTVEPDANNGQEPFNSEVNTVEQELQNILNSMTIEIK